MNKIVRNLTIFCGLGGLQLLSAQNTVELTITPQSFQALKLACIVDPHAGPRATTVATLLKPLLSVGDQFAVTLISAPAPSSKQDVTALAKDSIALACFITQEGAALFWRLYDVGAAQLLCGRKTAGEGLSDAELAMHVAGQVWQELTSQPASFNSLIAACKKKSGSGSKKRLQRALCLIHPFLSFAEWAPTVLVDAGDNFAPRWHNTRSVIFYSYHTPTNIRLMSIDPQLSRHVITNFDGQNITPAVAANGTVVLALSVNDGVQLFLYTFDQQAKKGAFTQLTHEQGDCVSPSFINSDQVVFCHINDENRPRVGTLTLSTRKISWLSLGAAFCPMANPAGTHIAYCKRVAGISQLFVYDRASGHERQLTHDKGHKDECSWSPCGNYLVCSVEHGSSSRIAVVSLAVGAVRFITPAGEHWSSPCWSPQLSLPFSFGKKRVAVVY